MRIIEPDERFRVSFLEAWDEFDAEDGRGAECSGAFGFTRRQCDSVAGALVGAWTKPIRRRVSSPRRCCGPSMATDGWGGFPSVTN